MYESVIPKKVDFIAVPDNIETVGVTSKRCETN